MHGLPWWFGLALDPRSWIAVVVLLVVLVYLGIRFLKKKKKHNRTNTTIPTIVLAPSSTDTNSVG